MGYMQEFLEEYRKQESIPRTFNDYLLKKYKKDEIDATLWGLELKYYASKYFEPNEEEAVKIQKKIDAYCKKTPAAIKPYRRGGASASPSEEEDIPTPQVEEPKPVVRRRRTPKPTMEDIKTVPIKRTYRKRTKK